MSDIYPEDIREHAQNGTARIVGTKEGLRILVAGAMGVPMLSFVNATKNWPRDIVKNTIKKMMPQSPEGMFATPEDINTLREMGIAI